MNASEEKEELIKIIGSLLEPGLVAKNVTSFASGFLTF